MSKGQDFNILKMQQTSVLKVNIHCDGCKKKVKKLLQKIDGVYSTLIDGEQGKVTVSGTVDASTLIKNLTKAGKHTELWPTNGSIYQQQQKKLPINDAKSQQKLPKEIMDIMLPVRKDKKPVKFCLPHQEFDHGNDSDDDFGNVDDDYFDDTDSFDEEDDYKIDVLVMNTPTKEFKENKGSSNKATSKCAKISSGNGNNSAKGEVGIPAVAFRGMTAAAPPPQLAGDAGNPYTQQQQYLAAMMQQQRMMMNGQVKAYGQPMGHADPFISYFSDENTSSSCTIM